MKKFFMTALLPVLVIGMLAAEGNTTEENVSGITPEATQAPSAADANTTEQNTTEVNTTTIPAAS